MLSFSVCFMCRYYSVITNLSITSDFAEVLHLFFQNFALCFHNPIFLKILLAKLAHPYLNLQMMFEISITQKQVLIKFDVKP